MRLSDKSLDLQRNETENKLNGSLVMSSDTCSMFTGALETSCSVTWSDMDILDMSRSSSLLSAAVTAVVSAAGGAAVLGYITAGGCCEPGDDERRTGGGIRRGC